MVETKSIEVIGISFVFEMLWLNITNLFLHWDNIIPKMTLQNLNLGDIIILLVVGGFVPLIIMKIYFDFRKNTSGTFYVVGSETFMLLHTFSFCVAFLIFYCINL